MRICHIAGSVMFGACVLWGSVSPAAIIHRYSFNGNSVNDSVGNADGTLVNGAKVVGGQLIFDPKVNNGSNTDITTGQYVSFPSNLLHVRSFSIETWATFGGGGNWQRILDFGNSIPNPSPPPVGNIGHGFIILTPSNGAGGVTGQISINSWGDPSDTDLAYGPPVSTNVEHQIVYTHDPVAGFDRLFVDGAQVGVSTARVDPSTANYSNFWLGRSQFTQDPFYKGSIDELRIYDNSLSAGTIAGDYAVGPNVLPEPSALSLLAGSAWMLTSRRRRVTGQR